MKKFKIAKYTFFFLVVFISSFLIVRNIYLQNRIKKLENPYKNISDVKNPDKSKDVVNVHNGKKGLWDRKGEQKLKLINELTIGDEQDPNKTFYRAGTIRIDSENNIYVAESMSKCTISKFDSLGNFLYRFGRHGQGPGDLSFRFTFLIN